MNRIFQFLPISFILFLGRSIGLILYFNSSKRMHAFRNIKMAFPQWPYSKMKKVVFSSFLNFGMSIVETFVIERIVPYVETEGFDKLDSQGGILTGIHNGNWELYNSYIAQRIPFTIYAQKQKNKFLNDFINHTREAQNLRVCNSIKEFISYFHKKYYIGMAIDHGAEDNAAFVDFFSQKVPAPRGAVYLAKKYNKRIFPCYGYRKKGKHHFAYFGDPIDPSDKSEKELLETINAIYQEYICAHPESYLWSYKRFKRKVNQNVLILDDGKIGHLKQSQSLVAFLEENIDDLRVRTVKVKYRSRLTRLFTYFLALISPRHWLGWQEVFPVLFVKDTAKQLQSVYADLVISTGSFLAPVNKLVSACLSARSVSILKGNLPTNKFSLVVVPQHDRVKGENVCLVKGALSFPKNYDSAVGQCKEEFSLTKNKKIAFFLGSHIYDQNEFCRNLEKFLQELKALSLEKEYNILVSTSRRTSPEEETILRRELSGQDFVEKIVYVREKNYDFVFNGFLGISDFVFVSSDSVSMVSEVVSFSKPCVAVSLGKIKVKHQRFYHSLGKEVMILEAPYKLDLNHLKVPQILADNKIKLKEKLNRII